MASWYQSSIVTEYRGAVFHDSFDDEKSSLSRCADYGIAFVTPFQLFEKHLALVSYYIAKQKTFQK